MLQSMTAFARCSSQGEWGQATWEIRAVNHRYLDCGFKMPELLRLLEPKLRLLVQQKLQRGRIECSLKLQPGEKAGIDFSLNTTLVKKLSNVINELGTYVTNLSTVDPLKLLNWPDVLQVPEEDVQELHAAVLQLFGQALVEFTATRVREGEAMKSVLERDLVQISVIVAEIKSRMPQILENQRVKLMTALESIKDKLDPQRLEQEMLITAQKIDVTEELDRLDLHVEEVKRVLGIENAAGKRLDFLMQELNREANTLASKSVDATVTKFAIDLKVLIEEMREQVQNIV